MSRQDSRAAGKRKPPAAASPVAPVAAKPVDDDPWFAEEVTTSESADATALRLERAEAEAAAFEQEGKQASADATRKPTLESPIPSFLAASTQELEVADEDLEVVDGAPTSEARDVITRQIGVDRSPAEGVRSVPRSEPSRPPPLPAVDQDALAAARMKAAELVDRCREAYDAELFSDAAAAAEQVLRAADEAPAPGIAEVIDPARPMLERAFAAHVGSTDRVLRTTMDAAAISARPLDHRAGFLLSRIDGNVTIETLLEIAAMGRFDSLRTLSALLRDGLIQVR